MAANRINNRLVKSVEEIKKIEKSCRIVADTLSMVKQYMVDGASLKEIDAIAEDHIRSKGAVPAFKGYEIDGLFFPNSLCTSINEEVVHGIPGDRVLKEGDIVSIDCGAELDGYYGDSAVTYGVGEISNDMAALLKATEESLMLGISQALDKNKVYDISRAIQEYIEGKGYSLTRELVGHGIGKNLHEEPAIPNFVPPLLHRSRFPNMKLASGMTMAIEPMVHLGEKEVYTANDGWTIVTADGSPAAHFEHTVVVDSEKPIILTLRD